MRCHHQYKLHEVSPYHYFFRCGDCVTYLRIPKFKFRRSATGRSVHVRN